MSGTKGIIYANCAVSNANLDLTYREEGVEGNMVGIAYVDPGGVTASLAIDYSVTTRGVITVSLARAASAITTTGTLLAAAINGVKAAATLTSANTGAFEDGSTVTIGNQTYTFKTTLTASGATPYEVHSVTDGDTCLTNLKNAINGGAGTPGTDYGTGTLPNRLVSCGAVTAHAVVVTARWPGIAYNAYATTSVSAAKITGFGATTLGGGTAGVEPLDWRTANLITAANHSGNDGTGILAVMALTTAQSSGGTPGVGTAYDSATTAMAAGWMLEDANNGATVIQNDHATLGNPSGGAATITQYEGHLYKYGNGGYHAVIADTASHLLTAMKSYAIQKAANGDARLWAPKQFLAPTLYSA